MITIARLKVELRCPRCQCCWEEYFEADPLLGEMHCPSCGLAAFAYPSTPDVARVISIYNRHYAPTSP